MNQLRRRISALLLLVLVLMKLGADHAVKFFPLQPVLKAYTSEMRSTVNQFEFLNANIAPPQYPFAGGFSSRVLLNIQLGMEVPLIGGESERWRWYVGMPMAMDLMNDFFEKTTAPVMNTDYWFGARVEALYSLPLHWPQNVALRVLPFFHESTHIGDEVALGMAAADPLDFYRINVSYEAWEIAIGLDEWVSSDRNAFNIRLGLSGRWNADGYYSPPLPAEIGSSRAPSDVKLSRGNMEYFGQFNAVVVSGFPAIGDWVFQWGFELRNRILFDYFSTAAEKRVWTVDSTLGWYLYPEEALGRRLGFYLKLLGGQNPQGQYREQDGYFVFGAGFSLGM